MHSNIYFVEYDCIANSTNTGLAACMIKNGGKVTEAICF